MHSLILANRMLLQSLPFASIFSYSMCLVFILYELCNICSFIHLFITQSGAPPLNPNGSLAPRCPNLPYAFQNPGHSTEINYLLT